MNTTTPNQALSERRTTQIIKLSLNGQKRFAELSKNPPAPTAAMEKLKNLPDFSNRIP